ncbi:MAG: tetratricopeptide repeat protein, partial [Rhodoferax sp.]|nr:tetratricopeptide repeat protein [Rhodoferax sp.]
MDQILLPSEVYTQLSLWCKLHQGFGLSYVFSDDQIGMHWLRERLAEDFRHAPQETGPHAAKQRTLLFIADPDPMAFFRPLAEYRADTTPVLFWLQPPADAVLVWLKRLNEQRQRLIARNQMLILCLPTDSLTLEQATAIAVDLWAVRSFAYTARGRYYRDGFRADTDFAQTPMQPSPAKAESTWTPAMSAWQTWYEKNADLPTDSDKRLAGPLSLSLQASEDAQGLQQWDVAVRFAEDALALWQRLGEAEQTRFTAARLALLLGLLKYRLGHFDSARSCYTQALDLFAKEQYDPGRAHTLRSLGDLDRHLGQVDTARSRYTQALGLYAKEQADLGRANSLKSLGDLDRHLGEVDTARSRYTQALGLYAKEQDDLGRANTLQSLGDLDHRMGQVDTARKYFSQALDLFANVQNDLGRANTLQSLGDLERLLGQVNSAHKHYTQALDLFAQVKDPLGQAYASA